MIDFILLAVIVGLFCVVIGEFIFLQWVIEQEKKEKKSLLDQLQAQNRALISKNAHDYVMTTSIDKVMTDEKTQQEESDEVPKESVSDEVWYKHMGIKEPEKPAN